MSLRFIRTANEDSSICLKSCPETVWRCSACFGLFSPLERLIPSLKEVLSSWGQLRTPNSTSHDSVTASIDWKRKVEKFVGWDMRGSGPEPVQSRFDVNSSLVGMEKVHLPVWPHRKTVQFKKSKRIIRDGRFLVTEHERTCTPLHFLLTQIHFEIDQSKRIIWQWTIFPNLVIISA